MQIEIKETIPLHDEKGFLTREGWSRRPYWQYDRKKIKSSKFRIKEWDYYAAISQKNEYGVVVTISDLGYIGYCSITFLDFKNKSYHTDDSLFLLPLGRLNLPSNSIEGFIKYENKKIKIVVESNHSQKKIHFYSKNIEGNLILNVPIDEDSICIATSWKENRKAFYYNQKINCIKVNGQIQFKKNLMSLMEKQI